MQQDVKVDLKRWAEKFFHNNPKLADSGEVCIGIDDVGHCSSDAMAWALLLLFKNARRAELIVEGTDDPERLKELLYRVLAMDVGP
jgi:hypothetical protein